MRELIDYCLKVYRKELKDFEIEQRNFGDTSNILFSDECYLDLAEMMNLSIEQVTDMIKKEHDTL